MKKVAVIILNYKSWEDTIKEIELLNNYLKIDHSDIIVVENASPNESLEQLEIESSKKGFILLNSEENGGYAAGNNIGLRYAYKYGYDYAWILNNDIIVNDKDIVKKLISVFNKNNKIAVVNPDIYSPDGHMFNRDAVKPKFIDFTIGLPMYKKKGRKIKDLGGYAYIYRPQGCCMMLDLKKIRDICYLDEHTFLYWEESILAERLLRKKYRCALCTTAKIIHNHSKTVKDSISRKKVIKINNESLGYYLRRYRGYKKYMVSICKIFNYLKMWMIE